MSLNRRAGHTFTTIRRAKVLSAGGYAAYDRRAVPALKLPFVMLSYRA